MQEEVKDLESQVEKKREETPHLQLGSTKEAKEEAADKAQTESEEEDDDAEEEAPPPPPSYLQRGPRASVSAEAYGAWNKEGTFVPKVYPKSEEQKTRLQSVLQDSFLFASLEPKSMQVIIDAVQEKNILHLPIVPRADCSRQRTSSSCIQI